MYELESKSNMPKVRHVGLFESDFTAICCPVGANGHSDPRTLL